MEKFENLLENLSLDYETSFNELTKILTLKHKTGEVTLWFDAQEKMVGRCGCARSKNVGIEDETDVYGLTHRCDDG